MMAAVSHCSRCAAIVNIHWPSCLVCHAILPSSQEVPAASTAPAPQGEGGDLVAPILPGWLVAYRDQAGRLCGGAEDRAHGTVKACQWNGSSWILYLTNGQRLPILSVRAVARTDASGHIREAWTTREHGYDGTGQDR